MGISEYFPMWRRLAPEDQEALVGAAFERKVGAGDVIHSGGADCVGLLAIKSGRLRSYILSREGRKVTIYRLFERDICLFSASCMLYSIQFDVTIEAEVDTALYVIPTEVYKRVMERSAALANYTNQIMAARFSEVMWLIEQIMWKSMDKRLAAFLIEQSAIEESAIIGLTHDRIANHLGTAREVVTRMLRYFQNEGMVKLGRGSVELKDGEALSRLADAFDRKAYAIKGQERLRAAWKVSAAWGARRRFGSRHGRPL